MTISTQTRSGGAAPARTLVISRSLTALLLFVAPVHPIQAQRDGLRHGGVVVALVTTLPDANDGDVGVIRRGPASPDTILLRMSGADGEALAAAVFKLLAARQLMGDLAPTPMAVRVASSAVPAAWRRSEVGRAAKIVRQLQASPPRVLPGLGIAYVATIQIANRRVLSSARRRP